MAEPVGDWHEWGRHVLNSLEDTRKELVKIRESQEKLRSQDISALKTEVALLKLRASMLGAGAGGVIAILAQAAQSLLSK